MISIRAIFALEIYHYIKSSHLGEFYWILYKVYEHLLVFIAIKVKYVWSLIWNVKFALKTFWGQLNLKKLQDF